MFRRAGYNTRLRLVINDNYESTTKEDLTPFLPDQLLHSHMHSECKEENYI